MKRYLNLDSSLIIGVDGSFGILRKWIPIVEALKSKYPERKIVCVFFAESLCGSIMNSAEIRDWIDQSVEEIIYFDNSSNCFFNDGPLNKLSSSHWLAAFLVKKLNINQKLKPKIRAILRRFFRYLGLRAVRLITAARYLQFENSIFFSDPTVLDNRIYSKIRIVSESNLICCTAHGRGIFEIEQSEGFRPRISLSRWPKIKKLIFCDNLSDISFFREYFRIDEEHTNFINKSISICEMFFFGNLQKSQFVPNQVTCGSPVIYIYLKVPKFHTPRDLIKDFLVQIVRFASLHDFELFFQLHPSDDRAVVERLVAEAMSMSFKPKVGFSSSICSLEGRRVFASISMSFSVLEQPLAFGIATVFFATAEAREVWRLKYYDSRNKVRLSLEEVTNRVGSATCAGMVLVFLEELLQDLRSNACDFKKITFLGHENPVQQIVDAIDYSLAPAGGGCGNWED